MSCHVMSSVPNPSAMVEIDKQRTFGALSSKLLSYLSFLKLKLGASDDESKRYGRCKYEPPLYFKHSIKPLSIPLIVG